MYSSKHGQSAHMNYTEVICATGIEQLTEDNLSYMESIVPQYRLKRARSYIRLADRYNCIAAYFLLIYSVSEKYGYRELPEIIIHPMGKPYFLERGAPCFNLSHCSGAVCCGISSHTIGVDIQDPVREIENIISFAMSEKERAVILSADDPEKECAGIWSMKEAYLKYTGTGLSEFMRDINLSGYLWKSSVYRKLYAESFTIGRYSVGVFSQDKLTVCRSGHINDIVKAFRNGRRI